MMPYAGQTRRPPYGEAWRDFSRTLRQDPLHHLAMHVGEAVVAALEAVGQLRVVEAEQVQDRRLQIVDVDSVLRRRGSRARRSRRR